MPGKVGAITSRPAPPRRSSMTARTSGARGQSGRVGHGQLEHLGGQDEQVVVADLLRAPGRVLAGPRRREPVGVEPAAAHAQLGGEAADPDRGRHPVTARSIRARGAVVVGGSVVGGHGGGRRRGRRRRRRGGGRRPRGCRRPGRRSCGASVVVDRAVVRGALVLGRRRDRAGDDELHLGALLDDRAGGGTLLEHLVRRAGTILHDDVGLQADLVELAGGVDDAEADDRGDRRGAAAATVPRAQDQQERADDDGEDARAGWPGGAGRRRPTWPAAAAGRRRAAGSVGGRIEVADAIAVGSPPAGASTRVASETGAAAAAAVAAAGTGSSSIASSSAAELRGRAGALVGVLAQRPGDERVERR